MSLPNIVLNLGRGSTNLETIIFTLFLSFFMSSSGKFGAEAVTIITSSSILRGGYILLPNSFSISYGSRADFFFHLTDLSRKPPF
jgi:hypothetical protein